VTVFRIDFKGTEWFYYGLQVVHLGKQNTRGYRKKKERLAAQVSIVA